ncbi:MAG: hypothetical protein US31_C0005G0054 [Berkelbacteria bacterium GW2011_GWA1_36_9]|uniref:Glycosyltransferase RgtA/B/C/D-like domain-containing protein n=1 Tax=Berkelbacteria bacterium GW2011_GWA1_36_9 TaxID=1618331 RepID=A0A0G0I2A4_9BACT|nr:MAG: hypothetical protein US31_C0005G0054 [Berkelbacteria bacterium GW2011_GWA1_36_9]
MKKLVLIAIILLAAILRFYKLAEVPPSLYWDEASLGYNAYSILKTGHDEHGVFLPITNFAAFGDYKPPGYVYMTTPSIALLGLTELAVRFPSALFGMLTVFLTYLIAKKLFENDKVALFASFFLAISPWHLQMSRAAFEANLGLFFSTLAVFFFIKFSKNPYWLLLSALSFLAAMYTFTGQRLFVPLIALVLAIQLRRQIFSNLKIVLATTVICAILFWPLFRFVTATIEGKLRFNEVTIFKDLKPINDSVAYRQSDNFALYSSIIHNRRLFYLHDYLTHYFDAFNPTFLFISGDVNPRLSIQEIGQLYYFDIFLLPLGVYLLFAKKHKYRFLILGWLLISPLGPATARETPHALRMAHILPTFQLIGAFAIYRLYRSVKLRKMLAVLTVGIVTLSFFYYLHMYYIHYATHYSDQWQYGYKQAVKYVKDNYNNVDNVVVTKSLGRPYIYFLFYNQYDPTKFWRNSTVTKDEFFFIDVTRYDKFYFSDEPPDKLNLKGKTLFVTRPNTLPEDIQKTAIIKDPGQNEIFEISKKDYEK